MKLIAVQFKSQIEVVVFQLYGTLQMHVPFSPEFAVTLVLLIVVQLIEQIACVAFQEYGETHVQRPGVVVTLVV